MLCLLDQVSSKHRWINYNSIFTNYDRDVWKDTFSVKRSAISLIELLSYSMKQVTQFQQKSQLRPNKTEQSSFLSVVFYIQLYRQLRSKRKQSQPFHPGWCCLAFSLLPIDAWQWNPPFPSRCNHYYYYLIHVIEFLFHQTRNNLPHVLAYHKFLLFIIIRVKLDKNIY